MICNLKKNRHVSFEDAVENSRDSLSGTLYPHVGEEITSRPEGDVSKREAGNDSDMAEEERNNNDNLTEPRSAAVNENWLDDRTLVESLQPKHEHISSDCTDTGCECVAAPGVTQDDAEEARRRGRQGDGDVHCEEDFVTRASSSNVGFHPEESGNSRSSKTKHVIIMVTQTRPAEEEEVEPLAAASLEPAGGPSCFQNIDEDERTGAAEDSEGEETRDASPDVPVRRSLLPKDTAPNMIAASAVNDLQHGSTCTRGTFLPGPPTDKQNQIPAFFRGLRVLKKGVVGPEHDTVAQIKPSSQETRGEISPEKQGDAKAQGRLLGHISQFLTRKKSVDEKEEMIEMEGEGDQVEDEESQIEESEMGERKELETEEGAEVSSESPKPSVSSAESAFDAFKAFFTPKPLKKDPTEKVDLDAVRKKIRADKEMLRALFERKPSVTPEKRKSSDGKVRVVYE